MTRRLAVLLVGWVLAIGISGCRPASVVEPEAELPAELDGPRLVLFLVVDQMRAEYLDRFGPLFTGGLARLNAESVRFTQAHHFHSATETAPGHATLSTGLFPSHHGIVANYWFDRQEGDFTYSVSDPTFRRSPRNLDATTLGSWIKAASPASKVFAASGKDRSALLTAGKEADGAFWYDREDGSFTSTGYYYPDELPTWLLEFNDRKLVDDHFATLWEALPEARNAGAEIGIADTDLGPLTERFPHTFGSLSMHREDSFYASIYSTPVVDSYLAQLARALIEGEQLGQDGYVDFLGLSFSATDTVGHGYGPNSREVLDTLLRLDRELEELFDYLDRTLGMDKVIVSLSADHGVLELPEYLRDEGLAGRRLAAADLVCMQSAGEGLAQQFGDEPWVLDDGYLDEELIAERGLDLATVERAAAHLLEACPGIARVWTRTSLEQAAAAEDPIGQLFVNVLHPQRRANYYIEFEPSYLPIDSYGTTHGSPHRYDTHVPWLLRLPDGAARRIETRVHTVDVAPTIAALLGAAVEVPASLDGVDRLAED